MAMDAGVRPCTRGRTHGGGLIRPLTRLLAVDLPATRTSRTSAPVAKAENRARRRRWVADSDSRPSSSELDKRTSRILEPISSRKWTELGAEYDRSRRMGRPYWPTGGPGGAGRCVRR